MERPLEKLHHEALALPAADRVALVERLVESLEAEGATELAGAAFTAVELAEFDRRSAEADAGTVELIPWEEAMVRARAAI